MTALFGRRAGLRDTGRRRPRAVWAAFVTSLLLAILIVSGVLLPVLGIIAGAAGLTAGTLDVPVGPIALAIAIGYVLAIALLALCVSTRSGPLAWVLGVAAVISTALVSVWPLVAVALSAVDQVQDVVPFIQELVGRVLDR